MSYYTFQSIYFGHLPAKKWYAVPESAPASKALQTYCRSTIIRPHEIRTPVCIIDNSHPESLQMLPRTGFSSYAISAGRHRSSHGPKFDQSGGAMLQLGLAYTDNEPPLGRRRGIWVSN